MPNSIFAFFMQKYFFLVILKCKTFFVHFQKQNLFPFSNEEKTFLLRKKIRFFLKIPDHFVLLRKATIQPYFKKKIKDFSLMLKLTKTFILLKKKTF